MVWKPFRKKFFKKRQEPKVEEPKFQLKVNKNFGICDVTFGGVRTEACKRTLNMFRGQDYRLTGIACLNYAELSTLMLQGNKEAETQLSTLHYMWNQRKYETL